MLSSSGLSIYDVRRIYESFTSIVSIIGATVRVQFETRSCGFDAGHSINSTGNMANSGHDRRRKKQRCKSRIFAGRKLNKKLSSIKGIAFDFDGVFTDNRVYVMQNGEEAVLCDRSDGMGIAMLREAGFPMVIISTEKNPVVSVRGAKLRIIVLQGFDDKLPVLESWVSEQGLTLDQVAFLGNDINDVECLRAAGVGVTVADAYQKAVDVSDMQLSREGGRGAIREFADIVLSSPSNESFANVLLQ
jgi:YrbI family 3-deoxy-D-manno-octulosonate 8-phosphate phosphatase